MELKGVQIEMNNIGEIPSVGEIYKEIRTLETIRKGVFSHQPYLEESIANYSDDYLIQHSKTVRKKLAIDGRTVWNEWFIWDDRIINDCLLHANNHPWICYFLTDTFEDIAGYFEKKWIWSYHNYDDAVVEVFSHNEKIINILKEKYSSKAVRFPGLIGTPGD